MSLSPFMLKPFNARLKTFFFLASASMSSEDERATRCEANGCGRGPPRRRCSATSTLFSVVFMIMLSCTLMKPFSSSSWLRISAAERTSVTRISVSLALRCASRTVR